jgi:hypothetical protein
MGMSRYHPAEHRRALQRLFEDVQRLDRAVQIAEALDQDARLAKVRTRACAPGTVAPQLRLTPGVDP